MKKLFLLLTLFIVFCSFSDNLKVIKKCRTEGKCTTCVQVEYWSFLLPWGEWHYYYEVQITATCGGRTTVIAQSYDIIRYSELPVVDPELIKSLPLEESDKEFFIKEFEEETEK